MAALNLLRRWRSDVGSQLIEFMLVFPILMLLIAGIFDFGMMMRTYEVVVNATREGARVAVLDGYGQAAVDARIAQYLAASGLTGPYNIPPIVDVPVTTVAGTFTARRVQLNYFYNFAVLPDVGALFGGSFTSVGLSAVSVMRAEIQAAAP